MITDLGGGFGKALDENLADKWFVLDHHQIPKEEFDNERVINAWKYGIDGGTQISAGGMAYQAAKVLDDKNKLLINERLCLVSSFKSTIHNALGLLGILSPNMM